MLPVFNRRKPVEKQAELDLIDEWEKKGVIAVTDEDMKKLEAMRQSAMAHPTVNRIMSMEGTAERSYFWTDDETGMKLKCRPDWEVQDITDKNRPSFMDYDEEVLVVDAKTIAGFDRMETQIEKLKYWVQDSFYTRGVSKVLGKKVCFIFIFVSTTMALGRYPVKVVKLSESSKFDGDEAINAALQSMSTREDWETVVTLDRPMWAVNNDDNI